MKLTCVGKYGPYPKPMCACSCYLLQSQGINILIDLGCGSLTRVFSIIGTEEIDAVILSHLHADHMGDMLTLRYALAAARKLGKRLSPLPVYMPAKPAPESKLIASSEMIEPHYIADGAYFDISGIDAEFALMPHAVPSYAVLLQTEGKKLVYSGDTSYNEKLSDFSKDSDMMVIEAAFLKRNVNENPVHLTAAEAAEIGSKAGAKRLLLTHIFPEYEESEILREAREVYPWAEIIEELRTYEV